MTARTLPRTNRPTALHLLGAALLGFCDACHDIRVIARTG